MDGCPLVAITAGGRRIVSEWPTCYRVADKMNEQRRSQFHAVQRRGSYKEYRSKYDSSIFVLPT